jgi:hypothetical protein
LWSLQMFAWSARFEPSSDHTFVSRQCARQFLQRNCSWDCLRTGTKWWM